MYTNFDDISLRLSAGVQLQTALRTLEVTARKKNFRRLSRVAALLHDTLKHNHIEGFSRTQLIAFKKATHEAIETAPQKANPYKVRRIYRGNTSTLL